LKNGWGKEKRATLSEDIFVTIRDDIEIEHLEVHENALDLGVVDYRYAQHFSGIGDRNWVRCLPVKSMKFVPVIASTAPQKATFF
jgi:hypothetical protein